MVGVFATQSLYSTGSNNPLPAHAGFALASVGLDDPDPKFVPGDENAAPNQYVVSFIDGHNDDWVPTPVTNPPVEEPGGPILNNQSSNNLNTASTSVVNLNYNVDPVTQVDEDDWVNPPDQVSDPAAVVTATNICGQYSATLVETYDELGSFLATMTETQARAMSHDSRVQCVMADIQGDGDAVQVTPPVNSQGLDEWALDRIDQRDWPRSQTYTYSATGAGVHVYVVDSGLRINHPDIAGRASLDYSALRGRSPIDWHGHGTAVASNIGGIKAGVAKGVYLHSVRVLDDNNKTYQSTVIKALDWVRKKHIGTSVVNCSWGFKKQGSSWFGLVPGTVPIEKAVKRLLGRNIPVIISAGNEGVAASGRSPATVNEAITVAASDVNNVRAVYSGSSSSNYGGDVDIFGPGKNVYVATWRIDAFTGAVVYGYGAWNGTSFAAPIVAGAVAKYRQLNPSSNPATIQTWLTTNSSLNKLGASSLPSGTPNKLLYTTQ